MAAQRLYLYLYCVLKTDWLVLKSRVSGHVECVEKMGSAHRIAVGRSHGRRKPRGRIILKLVLHNIYIWLEVTTRNLFFIIVPH